MRFLFIFIKVAIIDNALIFLLAFLHISETWRSNVSLLSILTSNNFSQSLFSIENSPRFIFIFSLVLTNKWSRLPLNKFSLNHLNNALEAFSLRNPLNHQYFLWNIVIIYRCTECIITSEIGNIHIFQN